jgi:hypothetical protein
MESCQAVGAVVANLGRDAMFVPSARARGTNLVVFPVNRSAEFMFEIIAEEVIAPGRPLR